jgi:hypothetical protein
VSQAVMTHAHCPVVTVRRTASAVTVVRPSDHTGCRGHGAWAVRTHRFRGPAAVTGSRPAPGDRRGYRTSPGGSSP